MLLDNHQKEIETRFKEIASVLEEMPVGVAIAEAPTGNLIFYNAVAARVLRGPGADCDGGAAVQVGAVHPDGRPYRPEEYPLSRALGGEAVTAEEMLYRGDDGTRACLLVNAAPLHDAEGKVIKAVSTFFDISEKRRFDARLKDAQTKLKLAVEIAAIGFWEWDVQEKRIFLSPQWKHLLGYDDHEIPNCLAEWRARLHPEDRTRVLEAVHAFAACPRGEYRLAYRLRHRDASYRWIEARAQAISDERGETRRLIGTHMDITAHRQREEDQRHATQHDRLTGLPNRALFLEVAEHWLAGARRSGKLSAVLFIDLDHFKPINDTYGHHIGDQVLQEVALRLRASFRSHDIIGRLGGDEFVVVVTQLDSGLGAAHAAAHALRQLSLPYRIGNLTLRTSPSIGISLFPGDGSEIDTLLRLADSAMYEAKQGGKAGFRFYMQNGQANPESMRIEDGLRHGLATGALQLHFQPIVDTRARRLLAVEALLRWPGLDGRGIPPDVFIPVAEQNGFIVELGTWVLAEACAQHRRWREQGLPEIDIAINLSAMQFREAGLPAEISRHVLAAGIAPHRLWMEISDRSFTGQLDHALCALQRLKDVGLRITLDDFGAGYSSLEQLSRLPLDRLKIDRSLIAALPANRASLAVTEAAIAYGNALGIEVVAEGLETQQVLGYLRQHRCHRAQGYLFAPAMPAEQFTRWYRQAGLA